jgi:DNA (cytosine-5)-methyltransferase 1
MPSFYEFFAGGGMARAGLGKAWECLFANDIDEKKCASYSANWGAEHLKIGDVATVTTEDSPGLADVARGSFPVRI